LASTYTLHVPAEADPGDPGALERAELVKDGFSWGAFVLGPFSFVWFLAHRLWLVALGVLVLFIGFNVALQVLRIGPGPAFVAELLLSVLVGLEANSLRRWTLQRRKPPVDVVTAKDVEEAEVKSFARWLTETGAAPRPLSGAAFSGAPYRGAEPVIGLFPDMERSR
jgi:hypothetical protein